MCFQIISSAVQSSALCVLHAVQCVLCALCAKKQKCGFSVPHGFLGSSPYSMNISFLAYAYGSNVSYDTIARVFLPRLRFQRFLRFLRSLEFSCLRFELTSFLAYGSNVSYVSYDSSRWSGLPYGSNVSYVSYDSSSSSVWPTATVPTFPTIGRVLAAACTLHTRTDKSSRTWAYAYG